MKIKINNKESGLIISNQIHMEIQNGFRFLDKKKENLHQVACLRLFEFSHKNAVPENVGNHPNSFLLSSV